LGDTIRVPAPPQLIMDVTDHFWAVCPCRDCVDIRETALTPSTLITLDTQIKLDFWNGQHGGGA